MEEKIGVTEIRLRLMNYIVALGKIGIFLDRAAHFQKPPSDDFPITSTENDILLFDSAMREALMHAKFFEKDVKTLREVIGMVTFEDR